MKFKNHYIGFLKAIWLSLLIFSVCEITAQHPQCNSTLYSASSQSLVFFNNGLAPGNATSIPVPDENRLGIASSFSFPGPNPTFWTMYTVAGIQKPAYFNGTTWTVSPHNFPFIGQCYLAGNQNYLYALFGTNTIYRYSGTANAASQGTIGPLIDQIVVDDQDNIYALRAGISPTLIVYNSQLLPVCGYSLNGLPLNSCSAFAINGSTVNVGISGNYYVGQISGSVINFTQTPAPVGGNATTNLTSCHRVTTFTSTISSVTGPSLYCQQINTLTVSTPSVLVSSYQWSGPGIVSPSSSSMATINLPGVYTCTILTMDCPPMKSVSSYTVINAGGFFTPTLSSTGNLTCVNPTTQINASPNTAQHTFNWTGPGIVGPSNTPTIDVANAGVYSVLVTNTLTGCSSTAQIGIASGIGPLNLTTSSGDLFLCTPPSLQTITVSGAASYSWSPNIAISSTLGAVVTITPGSSSVYSISGTLGVCSGNTVINVFITPSPTLVTNLSSTTICNGTSVNLNVSGAYAYTWNPIGSNNTSVTISPNMTTIYTVTGNYGGCLSAKEVTVNVNPVPPVNISSTYSYICTGFSNTLSGLGAQTYTWYPGVLTSSSIIVTPTANQVYTVVGTSSLGCSSSAEYSLYVTSWYPLVISPSTPTLCQNQQFTLSMSPAWAYNSIVWSGPNLFPLSGGSVVISPSVNASYTVNAFNGSNAFYPVCNRSATIAVTVYSLPSIGVSATSTNICLGSSVTLTPSGAQSYSLGNPALQVGPQFTLTPTTSQNYTIYGAGAMNCRGTKTVQIVITPTPNISTNSSNFNVCPGGTAAIVAIGANSYTWNPGGLIGSIHQVSPQSTTVYTVTGNIGLCSRTSTLQLNVVQNPTLTVSPAAATVCSGNAQSANVSGASSYTWLPGNANGTVFTAAPLANTQFTVLGANIFNCLDTAYLNIDVTQNPIIHLTAQPATICAGGTSTLYASGANTFTWQPWGFVGPTYTLSALTNIIYTVTGVTGSCSSSSTIGLTVNPYPNLSISAGPNLICPGQQCVLTVSGASTYSWINTGQMSSSISVNPGITTTYSVLGTSLACTTQQTVQVFVHPILLKASSSQSIICLGESVTITASGALTYTWNNTINSPQIIVTPSLTTTYFLEGSDINACLTQTTIAIQVSECVGINGSEFEHKIIQVYPNPNHGELTLITTETKAPLKMRLSNNIGQIVYEEMLFSTQNLVNLKDLPKGVYTLIIFEDEQVYYRSKVIRQ